MIIFKKKTTQKRKPQARFKYMAAVMAVLLLASCSTPLKELTYLNGIATDQTYNNGPAPDEYRIRPNDQLFIQVITDDPANAAFLNLVVPGRTTGTVGSTTNSMELITYLVDDAGKISYPQLGDILVEGKTVAEVRDIIQKKVEAYLESASVFVKLVNRNITVLGEVSQPGQKSMVKSQLTIFEALGTAGDITDYGNRKNVKLIRELPTGKYIAQLDLTDPDLIDSPNYYILPHDIIYVEHSTKVYGAKNLSYATPFSITATVVSIGLLILNLLGK